jgi:hypothetical protein
MQRENLRDHMTDRVDPDHAGRGNHHEAASRSCTFFIRRERLGESPHYAIAEQNLEKNSKFFCAQRIDEPNCKRPFRWVHLSVGAAVLKPFGCGSSALGKRH